MFCRAGQADRARIDADTVDQHQRVVALGAADEQRRRLAGATITLATSEAGMESQQLRGIAGIAAFDRRRGR